MTNPSTKKRKHPVMMLIDHQPEEELEEMTVKDQLLEEAEEEEAEVDQERVVIEILKEIIEEEATIKHAEIPEEENIEGEEGEIEVVIEMKEEEFIKVLENLLMRALGNGNSKMLLDHNSNKSKLKSILFSQNFLKRKTC